MNTSIGQSRQTGGAHLVRDAHAPVDFPCCGRCSAPSWQELRRLLCSISVQRTPRRPGSWRGSSRWDRRDDKNLGVPLVGFRYSG